MTGETPVLHSHSEMRGRVEGYSYLVLLAGGSGRRLDFCRGRGHCLANEPGRNGRGQHGAIVVLLHFQSVEKRFYIRIAARRRNRPLGRVEELQKCPQLFGQSLGFVLAAGKGLRPEVHPSQVARRRHHRRRPGKQK